jgi:hypothetical protein
LARLPSSCSDGGHTKWVNIGVSHIGFFDTMRIKNAMDKKEIIQKIRDHVIHFKKWLQDNYSQKEIDEELYDDTGYPNWHEVEDTFEIAFKKLDFENLHVEDLKAISFLLARQWDVGIIFPYFKVEISQLGMTEQQLIVLAKHGLTSNDWSFRQQCAASICKLKGGNVKKGIEIALKYFEEEDPDIRRFALNSLNKLEYENLNETLERSWQFDNELERMLCLQIWKERDKNKFQLFLKEATTDERQDMKKFVTKLIEENQLDLKNSQVV